jgi:hypothetical protein
VSHKHRPSLDLLLTLHSRGKKTFRKFEDAPSNDAEDTLSSGDELRRKIGTPASGRLTRSSVKPRLLFQEEIRLQRLENGEAEDDDEEAITDIDVPVATPTRKTAKSVPITAVQEATPPPTRRVKRRKCSSLQY